MYFTRFKNSFQKKQSDFVVPQKYQKELCTYLEGKDVDMLSYDFVLVRNMYDVLKQVLAHRDDYHYKVGFRVSVPRTTQIFEEEKLTNKAGFLSKIKRYQMLTFSQYLIQMILIIRLTLKAHK